MRQQKHLTNERLKRDYANPFLLVNEAIEMAKELVIRDEDHEYNPANRVLEMIISGKELPPMPVKYKDEEDA